MKKYTLLFLALFIAMTSYAQAPEKMSYQAVVRDATNALHINSPVGMRISILQGGPTGTAQYVEAHTVSTNANGLVTIEVGAGTVISGSIAGIDWSTGPYFLKTETDPTGGTSYSITGTSQMLSVPYALHAKTADTALNDGDSDSSNELQTWGTLPGIPAGFADGTDDTGDADWTVSGGNVYNTTENIGVGISLPAAKMHIDGTGSKLLIGASGGVLSKLTVNAETGTEVARFRINGSTQAIINTDGDMGVGTPSPSAQLDVVGDTELNGNLTINNGTQAAGKVLISDAAGLATWQDPASLDDGDWTVAGGEIYRETGDVGIGTTNPSAALHIKQVGTAIGDGLRLESATTTEDWYVYMNGTDDLIFRNDVSNLLTIQKNTGNVAIGTVFATGYRLSVDGKLATEEVLIDDSGFWPDYVFAEDYKLLTIDELAQHIEEKKHLPGIPSAKEVEENGILSGDMHKRTMEKVEELSLYIIELHERVKALEEENNRLKSKRKNRRNR